MKVAAVLLLFLGLAAGYALALSDKRETRDCNALDFLEIVGASPNTDCPMTLNLFSSIDASQFLANKEAIIGYFATLCLSDCLPYVYSYARTCSNLPLQVVLQLACASNGVQPCYSSLLRNDGSGVIMQCLLPGACSDNCTREIIQFRDDIGCCVNNAYNTSAFGLNSFGIANYSLWSSCDVTTPAGFCDIPEIIRDGSNMLFASVVYVFYGVATALLVGFMWF